MHLCAPNAFTMCFGKLQAGSDQQQTLRRRGLDGDNRSRPDFARLSPRAPRARELARTGERIIDRRASHYEQLAQWVSNWTCDDPARGYRDRMELVRSPAVTIATLTCDMLEHAIGERLVGKLLGRGGFLV